MGNNKKISGEKNPTDALPKIRKVGRRSKKVKNFTCPTCGAGCATQKALNYHNYVHHNGSDEKRQLIAASARKRTAAHNKKSRTTAFCKSDDTPKLAVFDGDIDQNDPIDENEEEFLRIAKKERSVINSYYGNIIMVVPSSVKSEKLAEHLDANGCHCYIGTCASPGACEIHERVDPHGNISSVMNMLSEKDSNGKHKFVAYHREIEFNTDVSSDKNQKDAFKWESFYTYLGTAQILNRPSSNHFIYLNQWIEVEEGKKGELTTDQIRRAYRLGRSNYSIIGDKEKFQDIQIKFPLYDNDGNSLFTQFYSSSA